MRDLPQGWVKAQLGELLDLKYGKALPDKVRDGHGFPVYGSNGIIGSHSEPLTNSETLIVGRKGSVGEVQYSAGPCSPIDTTYYVDCLWGMPFRFWLHYLRYLRLQDHNKATAVPGLSREDANRLPIHLAPINEQKRIADKLDTLLARVDVCRERLDRVPQILKRFRQTVLAAATSGVLTKEWRERRDRQFDWKANSGAEVFPFITSGSRGWAAYYADSGSKFLRVGNLDHDTIKLDLSQMQYVSPPLGAEGVRTKVKVGDILISITADVGMIGFVSEDIGEAYINQHLCLARQNGINVGAYLAYYLASPTGGLQQLTAAQRGVTKAGLTLGDIRNLMINIPEEDEQTEIVRSVEQLFSFADQIEQRVNGAQSRVSHITQSILAKAFRGELTAEWREQNPNLISGENSAEALLARIKAEKAEAVRAKKTIRKSENTKAGKNMKPKTIIPVAVALKAAGTPLAAQALLTQSGYSSDATTEDLERFFLDIREQLKLGSILRERSGDEDIFALNK